jgi:hypothetical protein
METVCDLRSSNGFRKETQVPYPEEWETASLAEQSGWLSNKAVNHPALWRYFPTMAEWSPKG